jgi:hypothetical protein
MPDVDIDLFNRDDLLKLVNHIPASMDKDGNLVKHAVGVYFQAIPIDEQGLAAFTYEQAEQLGWQKFDFLNNSVYEGIQNELEIVELINTPVDWRLLEQQEIVQQLAHIGKYHALLQKHKPHSVEQLAMFLAILRPGKKHLQGKSWRDIEKEIWIPTEEYYFKKSHSMAFAVSIVVQLNKLVKTAIEHS